MQPYQQRVIVEKAELDNKRERLTAFIGGEVYHTLEQIEQSRLNRQLEAMTLYSNILGERISARRMTLNDLIPVLPANWSETQSPTLGGRGFISNSRLRVIASVDHAQDGSLWYHVSISRQGNLPSYDDMVRVKRLFIGDEREAIQVFPPRASHVNDHPTCLHLWHRIEGPVMPDMRKYEPNLRRLSI